MPVTSIGRREMTLFRFIQILGFHIKRGFAWYKTIGMSISGARPNEYMTHETPGHKVSLASI